MRGWRPVATVMVAVCLLLAGCVSEWERRMQALRDDPMASASWEGLDLLGTVETSNDSYKSPSPRITRCYKLGVSLKEAFEKAKETAWQYGWVTNADVKTADYFEADKTVNGSWVVLRLATESPYCDNSYPDTEFTVMLVDY
ncbi:MAG: hypothetical protein Q4D96_14950 [Propionibacteriaceae bacterium]|nr:hypothetical protein [Propionibacteriaceae bacterium]